MIHFFKTRLITIWKGKFVFPKICKSLFSGKKIELLELSRGEKIQLFLNTKLTNIPDE